MNDTAQAYDVVVVGGGAAGLSAALALGRARRSVLVIDAGEPRNAPAGHVHNYLTRDGTPPHELAALGRAEVEGYGGRIVTGDVRTATALPPDRLPPGHALGFRLTLEDGQQLDARRVIVATGLRDELPAIPGVAELWGRDVLHCPYCHGWEVRDQPVGVLSTGPFGVHGALLWRGWTHDVVLFTHTGPDLTPEQVEQLAARGVRVEPGIVTALETEDDRLAGVRLEDGRVIPRRALVVTPHFAARTDILSDLGVEAVEQVRAGHVVGTAIETDPMGQTSACGVYAAGNVVDVVGQVVTSAAQGLQAGAAANMDLLAEQDAAALESYRLARTAAFWEARYRDDEQIWSGRPNPRLVEVVADLPAGRALDLGCGEGADTVWLAERGWHVTAVDLSATAIGRVQRHAAEQGVADRVQGMQRDLAEGFPGGEYDLVSAQFLQSPGTFPQARVLRRAAGVVAPGGLLLVVTHAAPPPWAPPEHQHAALPQAAEILAGLELAPGEWDVEIAGNLGREAIGPDGQTGTLLDAVVAVRRRREPT